MRRGVLAAIIGGALLLIVAWYFLLFAPTSKDLNDTRDEVTAAESQKQELENAIRRLKELSANQTQQEADLRTLRAAIPPTPDLGEFILQANEIASASGIDWLSVSPSPPVASTGANSTIALSIQIDGGFFQVLDYLNRMEDLDRLVIVDGVSISSGSEDGGSSTGGTTTDGSSSTFDTGSDSSSGGAPSLSVTLTARMFTGQAPPTTGTGGTATAGGGTTTPSTPATPSPTATGAS